MNDREVILGWVVFIIFIIALILVSPVITIWSLNKVFNTGIETNIWTYLGTLWLTSLVAGGNIRSK